MDKEIKTEAMLDDELLPEELFTSAVAQIRSKENKLLSASDLSGLMSARDAKEAIQILEDRGWGDENSRGNFEKMIVAEKEKTWILLKGLVGDKDMHFFDIFRYSTDYHNLKVAIKESYIQKEAVDVYMGNGTIPVETIRKCAADNDFSPLPVTMMKAAQEARDALFHTGNSQLCDCIIDKAALTGIYQAGKDTKNSLIMSYVELKCGSADINIAIRACKQKKDTDFLQRALVECESISAARLIQAARNGLDAIYDYLSQTSYSDAVAAIKTSAAAFDKWCDDRMIALIKPQKYNAFTLSPLAAYMLAKENEIKSVRVIISGKLNDLSEDKVRERIRETYV